MLRYLTLSVVVIPVKYLREVTPYFRKTSALNDLGWSNTDTDSATTTKDIAHNKNLDRKSIPLKLCYLCRQLTMPDGQNRTFELHSADLKSCCVLRCPDDNIAQQWFNAIHANLHVLMQQAMTEANLLLSNAPNNSGEINHMGWLAEQVSTVL